MGSTCVQIGGGVRLRIPTGANAKRTRELSSAVRCVSEKKIQCWPMQRRDCADRIEARTTQSHRVQRLRFAIPEHPSWASRFPNIYALKCSSTAMSGAHCEGPESLVGHDYTYHAKRISMARR